MIIQFFITKSDLSPRIEYVLRFIGQALGYNYRIITTPAKLVQNKPLISFLKPGDLEKLHGHSGVNIYNSGQIYDLDQAEQSINIFKWQKAIGPVLGKRMSEDSASGWRKNSSDYTWRKTGSKIWSTEIDILTNIFYHLSRYEEKWRHFAEETASDYTTSILSRYHHLKVPVVDILLHYFQSLLEKKSETLLKILPWPGAEPFGAAITHDVDLTRAVSLKRRLLNNTYGFFKNLTGAGEVSRQLKQEMNEQDAQVWSYPQLVELYQKHNIPATFFFLTRIMEGAHVRYNINSKKFRELLRLLRENEHEIGLHSSLHAFDHPGRYKSEKERLEEAINTQVAGLRQHHLRGKFPRMWRISQNSGFKYDTSLGYNYQAGYRAGTTHPFYAYDYDKDQAYDLVEFSLAFFEHNLPSDIDSIKYIRDLLTQARNYGGLTVALLHPSNYLQEPYHDVWDKLINELKKSGAYIETLEGHYKWYTLREKIQVSLRSHNHIRITKPEEIQQFSIRLRDSLRLDISGKDEVAEIRPGIYTITSDKNKIDLKIV